MPFKLKHLVRGPNKVLHEVARTGLVGQKKEGDFRLLFVHMGKDLVPVAQGALIAAATVIGGPVAGAAAVPIVTGLSGGDDRAVTKASLISAATLGINAAAGAITQSIPQQVAIQTAGSATIAAVSDGNPVIAAVGTVAGASVSGGNPITQHSVNVVISAFGAAVNGDNILRNSLQSLGQSLIKEQITIKMNNKPSSETEKKELFAEANRKTREVIYDKLKSQLKPDCDIKINELREQERIELNKYTSSEDRMRVLDNFNKKISQVYSEIYSPIYKALYKITSDLIEKFKGIPIVPRDTTNPSEQPFSIQIDGTVCTRKEVLFATALDNAEEAFPLIGIAAALTEPELSICSPQYRESLLDTNGNPRPEPQVSTTVKVLQEIADLGVQITKDRGMGHHN
jgi:hypothetical protein